MVYIRIVMSLLNSRQIARGNVVPIDYLSMSYE